MAEKVFTIKRTWAPLADDSWRNIETIFEVQQQKTPPRKIVEPSLPAAPRKLQQQQQHQQGQIRREGLKPRRLIYDLSSSDSGIDADKENQPPPPPIAESGKSRSKRHQVQAIKDQKTKPASELRLRLRI